MSLQFLWVELRRISLIIHGNMGRVYRLSKMAEPINLRRKYLAKDDEHFDEMLACVGVVVEIALDDELVLLLGSKSKDEAETEEEGEEVKEDDPPDDLDMKPPLIE